MKRRSAVVLSITKSIINAVLSIIVVSVAVNFSAGSTSKFWLYAVSLLLLLDGVNIMLNDLIHCYIKEEE